MLFLLLASNSIRTIQICPPLGQQKPLRLKLLTPPQQSHEPSHKCDTARFVAGLATQAFLVINNLNTPVCHNLKQKLLG